MKVMEGNIRGLSPHMMNNPECVPHKKDCEKRVYYQKYYQKNKEKIDEINRKWRKNNVEKFRKYYRKYYYKNREKNREKRAEYYQKNKEIIKRKSKEYYQKNKKRIKAQKKSKSIPKERRYCADCQRLTNDLRECVKRGHTIIWDYPKTNIKDITLIGSEKGTCSKINQPHFDLNKCLR